MPRIAIPVVLLALIAPLRLTAQSSPQADVLPTFSTESELVVLHVAVRDRRGGYVGALRQDAFRIIEDRHQQEVRFFNSQDAPATVGLLIDSSGSMAPHRNLVISASMAFAKSMTEQDEFFVIGFNDFIHRPLPADSPFTRHEPTLRVALVQAIKAEGQTAIYDAIDAGLSYVRKGASERQVLVVVSDGGDNASEATKLEALTRAQASNALIYTIALVDAMERDADPGFLRVLAESTGGVAFRPTRADEIPALFQRVAQDIRSMYTIGYTPSPARASQNRRSASTRGEALRRVDVEVRGPDGETLRVRTRRAYLARRDGAER